MVNARGKAAVRVSLFAIRIGRQQHCPFGAAAATRNEFPASSCKGEKRRRPSLLACSHFLYNAAMRAVVQRVTRASVKVGDEITGEIANGLLVLLGVAQEDTEADADYLAEKIAGLRIFEDGAGKMNLSVVDASGAVLAVSQFTLFGDVRRGKRPSFDAAARPEQARELYEYFVERVRAAGLRCETGRFQATMDVELVNSGPVTILLDSKKSF
jgi:D-aminoacyl-tRNA deacylase